MDSSPRLPINIKVGVDDYLDWIKNNELNVSLEKNYNWNPITISLNSDEIIENEIKDEASKNTLSDISESDHSKPLSQCSSESDQEIETMDYFKNFTGLLTGKKTTNADDFFDLIKNPNIKSEVINKEKEELSSEKVYNILSMVDNLKNDNNAFNISDSFENNEHIILTSISQNDLSGKNNKNDNNNNNHGRSEKNSKNETIVATMEKGIEAHLDVMKFDTATIVENDLLERKYSTMKLPPKKEIKKTKMQMESSIKSKNKQNTETIHEKNSYKILEKLPYYVSNSQMYYQRCLQRNIESWKEILKDSNSYFEQCLRTAKAKVKLNKNSNKINISPVKTNQISQTKSASVTNEKSINDQLIGDHSLNDKNSDNLLKIKKNVSFSHFNSMELGDVNDDNYNILKDSPKSILKKSKMNETFSDINPNSFDIDEEDFDKKVDHAKSKFNLICDIMELVKMHSDKYVKGSNTPSFSSFLPSDGTEIDNRYSNHTVSEKKLKNEINQKYPNRSLNYVKSNVNNENNEKKFEISASQKLSNLEAQIARDARRNRNRLKSGNSKTHINSKKTLTKSPVNNKNSTSTKKNNNDLSKKNSTMNSNGKIIKGNKLEVKIPIFPLALKPKKEVKSEKKKMNSPTNNNATLAPKVLINENSYQLPMQNLNLYRSPQLFHNNMLLTSFNSPFNFPMKNNEEHILTQIDYIKTKMPPVKNNAIQTKAFNRVALDRNKTKTTSPKIVDLNLKVKKIQSPKLKKKIILDKIKKNPSNITIKSRSTNKSKKKIPTKIPSPVLPRQNPSKDKPKERVGPKLENKVNVQNNIKTINQLPWNKNKKISKFSPTRIIESSNHYMTKACLFLNKMKTPNIEKLTKPTIHLPKDKTSSKGNLGGAKKNCYMCSSRTYNLAQPRKKYLEDTKSRFKNILPTYNVKNIENMVKEIEICKLYRGYPKNFRKMAFLNMKKVPFDYWKNPLDNTIKIVGSSVTFTPSFSKNPFIIPKLPQELLGTIDKPKTNELFRNKSDMICIKREKSLKKYHSLSYIPITENEKLIKHLDDNSDDERAENRAIGKKSLTSFMSKFISDNKLILSYKNVNKEKETENRLPSSKTSLVKIEDCNGKVEMENHLNNVQSTIDKLKIKTNSCSGDDIVLNRYPSFISYEKIQDDFDPLRLFEKDNIASLVMKCLESNTEMTPNSSVKISEVTTKSNVDINISDTNSHFKELHNELLNIVSKYSNEKFSSENSPIIIFTTNSLKNLNECAKLINRNFSLNNLKPIKSYDSFKGFAIKSFSNSTNTFSVKEIAFNDESERKKTKKQKTSSFYKLNFINLTEKSKSETNILNISKSNFDQIILYNLIPNLHPMKEKLSFLIPAEFEESNHEEIDYPKVEKDLIPQKKPLSSSENYLIKNNLEIDPGVFITKQPQSEKIVLEMRELLNHRQVFSSVQKSLTRINSNSKLFQLETSKSSISSQFDKENEDIQKHFIKKSWDESAKPVEIEKKTSKVNSFDQYIIKNMKNKLLGETISLLKNLNYDSDESDYDDDLSLSTYTTHSSTTSDESFNKKLTDFTKKLTNQSFTKKHKSFTSINNSSSNEKYLECETKKSRNKEGNIPNVETIMYRHDSDVLKSESQSNCVLLSVTPAQVTSIAPQENIKIKKEESNIS